MINKPERPRLTVRELKSRIDEIEHGMNRILTRGSKYPKWNICFALITLGATVVIAASTYSNYKTTKNMFGQMRKQTFQTEKTINMQRDYYHNTTRPFIYVSDILIDDLNLREKTAKIKYKVKNIGTLPAKEVKTAMGLFSEADENFEHNDAGVHAAIFPGQEVTGISSYGSVPLETIRKCPYAHFSVKYYDIEDSSYYFKQIVLIRLLGTNDPKTCKQEARIINTWFN